MTLDTKALEAACRLAAKREAMRFKTIDEALEYEERCWRRHRDEVEPIIEAYLSLAATPSRNDILESTVDSLRAAVFEYQQRGILPGAIEIMEAQIAAIRALVKP